MKNVGGSAAESANPEPPTYYGTSRSPYGIRTHTVPGLSRMPAANWAKGESALNSLMTYQAFGQIVGLGASNSISGPMTGVLNY